MDIYAAIGAYHLLRILLTFITAFNLKYYLADITNAFLNAVLDKEVYIKCPLGLRFVAIYRSLNKPFTAFVQLLKHNLKSLYLFFLL